MTSASELFYNNRRYRFGRNSDSSFDVVSDLPSSINHRQRSHHSRGRDRLDLDICEPPVSRRNYNHIRQEREGGRIELGGQQSGSGNVNVSHSGSNVRGRSRLSPNERLPGAVLLARERLLQRLRSVTLSGSRLDLTKRNLWSKILSKIVGKQEKNEQNKRRRSSRSSSSNHHHNIVASDDFRLVDAADWETVLSSEWFAAITPLRDSVDHIITKRSQGLTQEAINCLPVEIFYYPKEDDEHNNTTRGLKECSICLESFLEGDELVRLPCGHRYHFCCLDPWVRTCGDCPYCRSGINVTSSGGKQI